MGKVWKGFDTYGGKEVGGSIEGGERNSDED